MDIRRLHYFVTIAQEKNITHAAEKLLITQPTLSRQMKDLEDELGVRLFRRSSRQLQLTDDGQYLYNRAQEILSLVQKTKDNLTQKEGISGDIYIGTAETASLQIIAEACKELITLHPNIRLHFRSDNADAVFEGLNNGTLDFGIIFGNHIPQKYHALSLRTRDRWSIIVPIGHPLASYPFVTVADILSYPLIVSEQSDFDLSFLSSAGQYHIVATYNLLYNAGILAKSGVGIILGLDGIISDPNLITIPLEDAPSNTLSLIWKDNSKQSPAEQAFLHEVKKQLSAVSK